MRKVLGLRRHFWALHKCLNVLLDCDGSVIEDIGCLPEGYTVRMSVLSSPIVTALQMYDGKLYTFKKSELPASVDLDIIMKSANDIRHIIAGKMGLLNAFNNKEFIVKGSVRDCVAFIRSIDRAMGYTLNRKLYVERFKHEPERVISKATMFAHILFDRRPVR